MKLCRQIESCIGVVFMSTVAEFAVNSLAKRGNCRSKCQSRDEWLEHQFCFVLVYNLVKMVMLYSAKLQKVDVEEISFVDALRWLAAANSSVNNDSLIGQPTKQHPQAVGFSVSARRLAQAEC